MTYDYVNEDILTSINVCLFVCLFVCLIDLILYAHKCLYFTDPLNGVLNQNLMNTCLSKLFVCEVSKRCLVYFH